MNDTKLDLLLYVKASMETFPDARFATSDPKHHAAADELISEGLLIEIEGPGGKDRAFALTDTGKKKMAGVLVT